LEESEIKSAAAVNGLLGVVRSGAAAGMMVRAAFGFPGWPAGVDDLGNGRWRLVEDPVYAKTRFLSVVSLRLVYDNSPSTIAG
jgi:hypothetical protein